MGSFLRSFALTFAVCVLVFFAAAAFEIINEEAQSAGFSEGEVFSLGFSPPILSGELFGESFSCNFSFAEGLFSAAEKAVLRLFLPARPLIWAVNLLFV